jgi:glyoxylase-like metal-dependent hydrolase (beta-lactamase superfamily II)
MSGKVKFRIINIGTLSMNKFWGETERLHQVSATCTLLEGPGGRLLVDPSPHPDPLRTLLFDRTGLEPRQIDGVFLTHFHGDHRFGLELFADRAWLMASSGLEEWRARSPEDGALIDRFRPAEGALPPGIELFPSPGHTPEHHSVIVSTPWGALIVAGDAVMNAEFFEAEEGYHNSVDFPQAAETARRIKQSAALVVPGHGNVILNL